MASLNEQYVVNENGGHVGVLLDWEEYCSILEELEELGSVRAYDVAKASGDEAMPFQVAVEEVRNSRGRDGAWGHGGNL
jgi:hypothetical protein